MTVSSNTRPTLVTVSLLLGTFLAALDVNVVGTSLPSVVAQLGGLHLYGWVFSAYLLTSTTSVPLYGRLADLHGRRPLYLAASVLFMVGSALCGVADSMLLLILFRALQGLGAGGLIPITVTLFGDLYPAEKRALVQGIFSVVWGVSSILGPLIGGFFVTYASWRWIFWINIPLGIVSTVMVMLSLHETVQRRPERGDLNLSGALVVISALSLLLVGLQRLGGTGFDQMVAGLLAGSAALAGLMVVLERRSRFPMFPPAIFHHRGPVVSYISGLGQGAILFPVGAFIPLLVQGVLHGSPTRAGLALVPMSVTWTTVTFATGWLSKRFGYRPVVVFGGLLLFAGTALLALAFPAPTTPQIYTAMAILGAGMSLTITPTTIAIQDLIPWNLRGMTTAMMQFCRTIGGSVAMTVLGILVTGRFISAMPAGGDGITQPGELLDPRRWDTISVALLRQAQQALGAALHGAFRVLAVIGLGCLLVALAFPGLQMKRRESDPD